MNRKLRVAIMGGGGIIAAHAPGYARLDEICEVVAVAEKNPARHEAIAGMLGDVPIYKNYADLYELNNIDAVDIILPHFEHMDAAVGAAKKGWHVLCEKVMARNVYECRQMIDACDAAGVSLTISHDRRYAGDWVSLKNIIDSGGLGDILFIEMQHNQDVIAAKDSWIRSVDGIGGGAVMSCLTHQIDALRWYGGEVESVNCMTVTEPARMQGDVVGVIIAKMKSGAIANLSINWHTQCHSWAESADGGLWYEYNKVTGTKGEAYFMHGKGTYFKLRDTKNLADKDNNKSGGYTKVEAAYGITGHQKCIEEFVKNARGEKADILTPGYDSLKTVEVAEAAYISEAQQKTVRLPITPVKWEDRVYMK
jgi:predicted dehydrogenase